MHMHARACTCALLWLAETKISISYLFFDKILWILKHYHSTIRPKLWYIKVFTKPRPCTCAAIWLALTLNAYNFFDSQQNRTKFRIWIDMTNSYIMLLSHLNARTCMHVCARNALNNRFTWYSRNFFMKRSETQRIETY